MRADAAEGKVEEADQHLASFRAGMVQLKILRLVHMRKLQARNSHLEPRSCERLAGSKRLNTDACSGEQ